MSASVSAGSRSDMFQPIVERNPHLYGFEGYGRAADAVERQAARAVKAAQRAAPGGGGVAGLSADVTWDAAYTEAPDETAHGDYMKLMASAGLAFDYVHLNYLALGDLRVTHTQRDAAGGVQWRMERARPILPPGMKPIGATEPDGQ